VAHFRLCLKAIYMCSCMGLYFIFYMCNFLLVARNMMSNCVLFLCTVEFSCNVPCLKFSEIHAHFLLSHYLVTSSSVIHSREALNVDLNA
jgi:hypothetical protein